VTLSSYKGKNAVVLFFYPKAATPGCTAEACSFRDVYERFTKAGAKASCLFPNIFMGSLF
jgi:peroxiredoxin Q/BCP